MRTETRYMVRDELVGDDEVLDGKTAAGRRAKEIREAYAATYPDRDPLELEPQPVEVLVDAFNVVSERDGEVVIREVAEDVAEREARRLAGEQIDHQAERRPAPGAHVAIAAGGLEHTGESPTSPDDVQPHPGYRVDPAPERIIEPDTADEEA